MKSRLQKILSECGICSRRAAEKLIEQGSVKVNGFTASLGDSADLETDEITVDGRTVLQKKDDLYIMLNKPNGYVTTLSDESGRRDVSQLVKGVGQRVFPVGRLDLNSEGLLLMTSDGALANALTHPSHEVYKQYEVTLVWKADGPPPEPPVAALSRPMQLDGVPLAPVRCEMIKKDGSRYLLNISIREGKNRQIRRMCATLGYSVISLKRVAVGDVKLNDLPVGQWRHLSYKEVAYLKSL